MREKRHVASRRKVQNLPVLPELLAAIDHRNRGKKRSTGPRRPNFFRL
jgi:hypothetical protein